MKPNSGRLLDRLAQAIRVRNYSYRTEQAYRLWVKQYIRFHNLKHPEQLDITNVRQFLDHLALDKNVSPSTQHQALNALNFLYRHVLGTPLEKVSGIYRARKTQKLPVVLTHAEIRNLFRELEPPYWLLAGFMYGSGYVLWNHCVCVSRILIFTIAQSLCAMAKVVTIAWSLSQVSGRED